VSDIQERNDRYFFIRLNKVLPPQQKELKNIKGLVAADYQKELEAQWIGHLRETYPVEVNDEVLQSVVNELQH
jgi:dUTPase